MNYDKPIHGNRAEYHHKYYITHKDKFHEYYLAHKDKFLEYGRRYYQRHKDKVKEYQRTYRRKIYVRINSPKFAKIFNKIWNEVKNGK